MRRVGCRTTWNGRPSRRSSLSAVAPSELFTFIVAVGGFGFLFYKVRHLDRYRREEQEARDFFEQHGHWPGETPEQAAAERELLRRNGDEHLAAIVDPEPRA